MCITIYLNAARTIVKEIHEWFENRKDKLYKRVRYFLGERHFVEYYNPGSYGEVKQWTEYPGKRIEIDFYVQGRLDRLTRRVEIIGEKITEEFEGRTDLIIYRSVLFTIDKSAVGNRQFPLIGGTLAPELYVYRIIQKFEATKNSIPGSEVSKREFFVKEGKLVATYHFKKNQVTSEVRTYQHSNTGPINSNQNENNQLQDEGAVKDTDALVEASSMERECYTSIKNSFLDMLKVHQYRTNFEFHVENEKTVFEIALDKADKLILTTVNESESNNEKDTKGLNYLTPYLRNIKDPNHITKEEALDIRQTCLDALRARLVERANIIQSRLNDENAKLAREQERFQRSQREGELSTEEYEKYCTEAMFRIQILETRLAAHEDAALKKFADLDTKLSNDERLRAMRGI